MVARDQAIYVQSVGAGLDANNGTSLSADHSHQDHVMNKDMIEGDWTEMKGKVREAWGKLTDDDIEAVAGQRDQLAGRIQHRYGRSKEVVTEEIASFEQRLRDAK
jgi:uncharacterized protein YjbJ (UPF0337 family)